MEGKKEMKCKKIKYGAPNEQATILFGVVDETGNQMRGMIKFKTGNGVHFINEQFIIYLKDTDIEFTKGGKKE